MAHFDKPTLNALLERVYRHYPRGLEEGQTHNDTKEIHRLKCVREAAAKSCRWNYIKIPDDWREPIDPEVQAVVDALKSWRLMAKRWEEDTVSYPLADHSNPWHDACYQYSALRSGFVFHSNKKTDRVTVAVSILAPVYAIYRSIGQPDASPRAQYVRFPDRYQERIEKLSEYVETLFGFHRLDEDVLMHPVPDVVHGHSNKLLGEAILRDFLFSPRVGPAESPD